MDVASFGGGDNVTADVSEEGVGTGAVGRSTTSQRQHGRPAEDELIAVRSLLETEDP
jgi:hypothetical protein